MATKLIEVEVPTFDSNLESIFIDLGDMDMEKLASKEVSRRHKKMAKKQRKSELINAIGSLVVWGVFGIAMFALGKYGIFN